MWPKEIGNSQKSVERGILGALTFAEEIGSLSSELKQMRRLLKNGGVEGLSDVKSLIYEVEDVVEEILFDGTEFQLISQKGISMKGWFAQMEKLIGCKITLQKYLIGDMGVADLISRIRVVNHELLTSQPRSGKAQYLLPLGQLRGSNDSDLKFSPSADDINSIDLENFWRCQEESIVGIEDAKEMISRFLLEEGGSGEGGEELKVISICGMGGIGKTTLARKVYQDESVRQQFDCVAWAFVGRLFRTRLVYEDILLSLTSHTREEMMSYSNLDLAELVYNFLQPRKYLIVLDDVSSVDAWDCLNIAFPSSEKSGSRVVLTTRNHEVAPRNGFLHNMSALNEEQSLDLLFRTAFRRQPPDPELTELGRDIVRSCSGLPLAIKVLGGLLASKKPAPIEWKMICQNMVSFQSNSDGSVGQILNLAYACLPLQLKACFLYFGIFPEDAVIETESLYHLWEADGLSIPYEIPPGKVSTTDVAEWYLYQLCIRNLVLVCKPEIPTGRWFESCHVHGLIHDLCLLKQAEDDFCVDVCFRRGNDIKVIPSSLPYSTPTIRRLALSFEVGCLDFHQRDADKKPIESVSINPAFCFHQRSSWKSANLLSRLRVFYLCNYKMLSLHRVKRELIAWHLLSSIGLPEVLYDLSASKSLRVLYCSGFNFSMTSLPTGIGKLRHLKYLSLRYCYIESLPKAICELTNLETLDMRQCTGTKMILPVELQKLISLTYLYLPHTFEVQGAAKLQLSGLINLEILVNFNSALCEVKGLCELKRLKKLVGTVCGDAEELAKMDRCRKTGLNSMIFLSLRVRISGYYSTGNHFIIEHLMLFLNPNVLSMEGHIGKLPMKVSDSFSELSLSGSELDEDPMEKLEKLPNLLVLSLRNNAYIGKRMNCSVSGMPQLRHLALLNLENLESLVVMKGGMPNLSSLGLGGCQNLKTLPPEFMDRVKVKLGERCFAKEPVYPSSKQADL